MFYTLDSSKQPLIACMTALRITWLCTWGTRATWKCLPTLLKEFTEVLSTSVWGPTHSIWSGLGLWQVIVESGSLVTTLHDSLSQSNSPNIDWRCVQCTSSSCHVQGCSGFMTQTNYTGSEGWFDGAFVRYHSDELLGVHIRSLGCY